MLNRVLRGKNDKRLLHFVGGAVHGDLPLLHHLKQSGLGLGGGAVNLINQHGGRENRALMELELARLRTEHVRSDDIRGHQVGRELDAAKWQARCFREELGRERFRNARYAFYEYVAASQKRGNQLIHKAVLPNNELGDFASKGIHRSRQTGKVRTCLEDRFGCLLDWSRLFGSFGGSRV